MKLEYLLPVVLGPGCWLALLHVFRLHVVDRILSTLYSDHRDIWESLGSPNGWQWSPPGRSATPWGMWSFPHAWLQTDPEWLSRVPGLRVDFQKVRALHRRMLWTALPVFGVGVLLFAAAAYLLQPS